MSGIDENLKEDGWKREEEAERQRGKADKDIHVRLSLSLSHNNSLSQMSGLAIFARGLWQNAKRLKYGRGLD